MSQCVEGGAELCRQVLTEQFSVGEVAVAITAPSRKSVPIGEAPSNEWSAGNVIRRLCEKGGGMCAKLGCQAVEGYQNSAKDCADMNYREVFESIGVPAEQALIIGLTQDRVGFYDQLEQYDPRPNSTGIREAVGFNAFFARASDEVVFGGRFADCAFVALEFKDSGDEDVIGFVHLTRTNLNGESQLKFTVDGKPVGALTYFLDSALDHYGGDKSTVQARLVTAINGENFPHTFDPKSEHAGGDHPDGRFPGWLNQGLMYNETNPYWHLLSEEVAINPTDVWYPMYRQMIQWQIANSGLTESQVCEENIIDPAVLELGYASNHSAYFGHVAQARDAYIIAPKSLLKP